MRRGSRWTRVVRRGLGTLLLAACAVAPARADVRMGYIDSARIWVEFKDAQEAQQRFDRQVQGWRDEAAEKEKVVSTLRQQVKDQSPVLSALKRQELDSSLQKAISDYEKFVQDVWGQDGRAAQENARATDEIVGQVRRAVEKVAGQKGLDLVLDVTGGFVVYADKTLDLTNDVLAELNANAAGTTPH
jgi:outer membrane protein